LDGEEEAGSPSFESAIERYRDKLLADLMLIFDGPEHPSSRPTLVFGARGNLGVELTVYGAKAPLHSGHYGNWAPNPAARLARLLATMKDEEGRTTIEGYYEGIEFSPEVRMVLDEVPDDHEALMKLYGFARPDGVGGSLQEAIQYPSFNIRGLDSGWVGAEARTAIPDRATASVDIRPVPETPNDDLFDKVVAHIRKQGYHIVNEDPDDTTRASYPQIVKVVRTTDLAAYRTPLDDPQAQRLVQALTDGWGEPPVRIRNFGSALPIAPLIQALGYPAISVCTVNFDNNQHGPNENLRLGHFFRMIVTAATVLSM
jgi:acetylornithine deacetylase/succinyl-diaminopimelate desuccinylase-like protein